MSRAVDEWVGKGDDAQVPPRVRLRVFQRDGGTCQCGCTRRITPGTPWMTDHAVALVNGGQNRESNLRTLLVDCHARKTAGDVAEKSVVAKVAKKHVGLHHAKRPMPGSRRSPWRKKINGEVVRR
jgi:5-methylcytosine-specific restriction protein A